MVSEPTSEASDPAPDGQLDEILEDPQAGSPPRTRMSSPTTSSSCSASTSRTIPKFPRVDDSVTYPKADLDIRQQLDVDSGAELPDYSGAYRADLRFTDFSQEALATKFLPWSEDYLQLCVDGWAAEVAQAVRRRGDGRDRVGGLERPDRPRARAHEGRVPSRRPPSTTTRTSGAARTTGPAPGSSTPGLFTPGPDTVELSKEAAGHLVPRQPRVPAAVHRGVGHPDHGSLRARRDVRHPVDAVGRLGAARGRRSSRPSTSASPATRSRTG